MESGNSENSTRGVSDQREAGEGSSPERNLAAGWSLPLFLQKDHPPVELQAQAALMSRHRRSTPPAPGDKSNTKEERGTVLTSAGYTAWLGRV